MASPDASLPFSIPLPLCVKTGKFYANARRDSLCVEWGLRARAEMEGLTEGVVGARREWRNFRIADHTAGSAIPDR